MESYVTFLDIAIIVATDRTAPSFYSTSRRHLLFPLHYGSSQYRNIIHDLRRLFPSSRSKHTRVIPRLATDQLFQRSCFRLWHDLGARIRARRGRWPSCATIRGNFCCQLRRPPVLLHPVHRRSPPRLYPPDRAQPRSTWTQTRPPRLTKPGKVRAWPCVFQFRPRR